MTDNNFVNKTSTLKSSELLMSFLLKNFDIVPVVVYVHADELLKVIESLHGITCKTSIHDEIYRSVSEDTDTIFVSVDGERDNLNLHLIDKALSGQYTTNSLSAVMQDLHACGHIPCGNYSIEIR